MPGLDQAYAPYCGAAPTAETLASRWNLDPILMAALLALALAYGLGLARVADADRPSPVQRSCILLGWALTALALISPLCALSVSLFSARVAQHMVLTLVAAPLVAVGRPAEVLGSLWPDAAKAVRRSRLWRMVASAPGATALFALFLWFWHSPAPYAATFDGPWIYWAMHLSLYGSALLLWRVLLDPARAGVAQSLAAGAISTLQMTFLGALLTLSPRLLFTPHLFTTVDWGLSPLSDQQIGGLIMWVPGCFVFLGVTLVTLARSMEGRVPGSVGRDAPSESRS